MVALVPLRTQSELSYDCDERRAAITAREESGYCCIRGTWPMPRKRSTATVAREEHGHPHMESAMDAICRCTRGGLPLLHKRSVAIAA